MQLVYYGDSLEHHGIKGQRWGIRRYQNKDGTYTSQGKNRYGIKKENGKKLSKAQRFARAQDKRFKGKTGKQILTRTIVTSALMSIGGYAASSAISTTAAAYGKSETSKALGMLAGKSLNTAMQIGSAINAAQGITGSVRAFRRESGSRPKS